MTSRSRPKPNQTPTFEEQFRELVTDPDPAAMKVAEDLVMKYRLSLADLGERWERDAQKMARSSLVRVMNKPSQGVFVLIDDFDDRANDTWCGWIVHKFAGGYEIELVYMVLGMRIDTGSAYTAAIGHNTYYKTFAAARRAAAADTWAVAKELKRYVAETVAKPKPTWTRADGEALRQRLIDALFAKDKTPAEVYGHRRAQKKWGRFDRPTGGKRPPPRDNPGELPAVTQQYQDLIETGMARVLWAYAYGAWAQQALGIRDPDVLDDFTPSLRLLARIESQDRFGEIAALPVQMQVWVKQAPPTPPPAMEAARALNAAITKQEGVDSIVDLYALAMEIDTGNPFAYEEPVRVYKVTSRAESYSSRTEEEWEATDSEDARTSHLAKYPGHRILSVQWVPPADAGLPEPEFFMDSNRGSGMPQDFANEIKRDAVTGVDAETWATLEAGDTPENEWYWEAWDEVQQRAVITDDHGQKWTLTVNENGDLFLIPDGMEWDDAEEWYVWPDSAAPPVLAEMFGQALAHMALEDGQSWFDNHKQRSASGNMEWKPSIPTITVRYSEDQEAVRRGAGGELTWEIDDSKASGFTERRVRITFESVTPGEEDDDEPEVETGWEDEEGVLIEPDEDESIADATAELILRQGGAVEASGDPRHGGHTWYTQIDGSEDYQTGERRTLSFHLHGYTKEEEQEVYDLIDFASRNRWRL